MEALAWAQAEFVTAGQSSAAATARQTFSRNRSAARLLRGSAAKPGINLQYCSRILCSLPPSQHTAPPQGATPLWIRAAGEKGYSDARRGLLGVRPT